MITFIYYMYFEGELMYIGHTENIDLRIKQHRWKGVIPFDKVEYFETTYFKGNTIETFLIGSLRPKYNLRVDWSGFVLMEYKYPIKAVLKKHTGFKEKPLI